jgi:hypothetical protein
MRAFREQPRLVLARMLGALCLIAAGLGIGAGLDGDDHDAARAAQLRLAAAQRAARSQRPELQRVSAELDRAVAARTRAAHALRDERRVTQRLRRELKAARRAHKRRTHR